MIRTLALIVRKPGVTRDDFRTHYEEVHVPLARPRLPGLEHYVRNHVVESIFGSEAYFDVATEFGYRSREDFASVGRMLGSDEGAELRRDEERFMNKEKNVFFFIAPIDGSDDSDSPGTAADRVLLLARARKREEEDRVVSALRDGLVQAGIGTRIGRQFGVRDAGRGRPWDFVAFIERKEGDGALERLCAQFDSQVKICCVRTAKGVGTGSADW